MTNEIGSALHHAVETYSKRYRHPDLASFSISKTHSMTSWYNTPESSKPGCYVFFSEDGRVLYVGKASLTRFVGNRVAAHDHRKPWAPWRGQASYVVFVSVLEAFEAPSLEEYLIGQLHPAANARAGKLVAGPAV